MGHALLATRRDIQQTAHLRFESTYKDNASIGDPDDDLGCEYIVALATEVYGTSSLSAF